VVSITKPGAERYTTTSRRRKTSSVRKDAGLILWNGLNLEQWFEKFLANLSGVPSVTVSDGVEPMSISQGPYSGKPNPHAWMSPENAKIYVDNIARAMAEADPANADAYMANADSYKAQIDAAAQPVREVLASIPEDRRWLVTSEGAFSYLARDFGLKELYLWPINADQQGTPKQVKQVVDTVRANNIPAVFSAKAPCRTALQNRWRERPARNTAACCMLTRSPMRTARYLPFSTFFG
jgi:manganese/iron transport system substrate-binding protein